MKNGKYCFTAKVVVGVVKASHKEHDFTSIFKKKKKSENQLTQPAPKKKERPGWAE